MSKIVTKLLLHFARQHGGNYTVALLLLQLAPVSKLPYVMLSYSLLLTLLQADSGRGASKRAEGAAWCNSGCCAGVTAQGTTLYSFSSSMISFNC